MNAVRHWIYQAKALFFFFAVPLHGMMNQSECMTLHEAAARGDMSALRSFCAEGKAVDITNEKGWTALHEAAFAGNVDAIVYLMRMGATLEAQTKDGLTPLLLAKDQKALICLKAFGAKSESFRGLPVSTLLRLAEEHCLGRHGGVNYEQARILLERAANQSYNLEGRVSAKAHLEKMHADALKSHVKNVEQKDMHTDDVKMKRETGANESINPLATGQRETEEIGDIEKRRDELEAKKIELLRKKKSAEDARAKIEIEKGLSQAEKIRLQKEAEDLRRAEEVKQKDKTETTGKPEESKNGEPAEEPCEDVVTLFSLGKKHYYGLQGMAKDHDKARECYEKAAHQKADLMARLKAWMKLGALFPREQSGRAILVVPDIHGKCSDDDYQVFYSTSNIDNIDKAWRLFEDSASQTDDLRLQARALLYLGKGLHAPYPAKLECLRLAAKQESDLKVRAKAAYELAWRWHWLSGKRAEINIQEALQYLEGAASQTSDLKVQVKACYLLGEMYSDIQRKVVDNDKARKCFERVANQNHLENFKKLAKDKLSKLEQQAKKKEVDNENYRMAEMSKKRQEEEIWRKLLEGERQKEVKEIARRAEEARRKIVDEKARLAEEAQKKQQEEEAEKKKAANEKARLAEAQKKQQEEEAEKKKIADEKTRLAEDAQKKQQEEEARKKQEEEKKKAAEEAKKKDADEKARLAEAQKKKQEEEKSLLKERIGQKDEVIKPLDDLGKDKPEGPKKRAKTRVPREEREAARKQREEAARLASANQIANETGEQNGAQVEDQPVAAKKPPAIAGGNFSVLAEEAKARRGALKKAAERK